MGQLSARNRRVLIGLAILTLSQFLGWEHGRGGTIMMAGIGSGAPVFQGSAELGGATVSGWSIHPWAALILPALIAAFAFDLAIAPVWQRYKLAITLILMVICGWFSLDAGAFGALVGWAGIAVAASAFRIAPAV